MKILEGKNVLLAVSGSIAAYKSLFLTRQLIKKGANVRVIMTKASCDFVRPLSFSTLSKNEVFTDVSSESSWNNHVELGLWADVMLVAPCTATTLAKMANGIADNMVVACYLSAKCPVYVAPAMDLDMWKHPSTKRNLALLESYGNEIISVGTGELASGLTGEGRMEEPENITEILEKNLADSTEYSKVLSGKTVLITAGPTYEDLDPVRYIGNRSSGKMGIALASACKQMGARVHLILGPSAESIPVEIQNTVRVLSAQEMMEACSEVHGDCDVAIFAAAVADYRPAEINRQKIKKKAGDMSIELERTPDIAATLGNSKKEHQIHIGFALETEHEEDNAKRKLEKKNFDLIVLNSLNDPGAGFAHDTNKIKIYAHEGLIANIPLQSKKKTAFDIIETAAQQFNWE